MIPERSLQLSGPVNICNVKSCLVKGEKYQFIRFGKIIMDRNVNLRLLDCLGSLQASPSNYRSNDHNV